MNTIRRKIINNLFNKEKNRYSDKNMKNSLIVQVGFSPIVKDVPFMQVMVLSPA